MTVESNFIEQSQYAAHPEQMAGRGRRPALDPRDRRFLAKPPTYIEIGRRSMHWIMPRALDQANTPHCVGYGWTGFLLASPIKNNPFESADDLYFDAQKVDEWEGEDYDGTSVRAGAKVLQAHGLLSTYEWSFNLDGLIRQVLSKSPVVVGTDWNWAMDETFVFEKQVFIKRGGGVAGGHCYVIKGVNLDHACHCGEPGAVRMQNSWSDEWGDKGHAWICLKDMDSLIANWGEVCIANELKFAPQAV